MRKKLRKEFYSREDVLQLARELTGKILVSRFDGIRTSGRIVEVEAYAGVTDKASHAFNNRRTARTEIMYAAGGVAYVYLCYGIHQLFNVVTGARNNPHAILIRALEPLDGIPEMLRRTGKKKLDFSLTRGPGNLSKALGIYRHHTGISLLSAELFIEDDGFVVPAGQLIASPRIGVDYAGEDALLLYRFFLQGNPYISGKPR